MSDNDYLLGGLLKNVSRSFYLTLRVLPEGLRAPIGLAYLLARAADTIADTAILPPQRRLELLLEFRAQVNGAMNEARLRELAALLGPHQSHRHERILLESLSPALRLLEPLGARERAEVRGVVTTLTTGMEFDLRTFPLESAGQLAALRDMGELDRYIYLVAGCVGEFWTTLNVAHTPALRGWNVAEMSARGVRFGKALQLTNVLRDCAKDLRSGRCYLPADKLAALGLRPEDLLQPENAARARPLLVELLRAALDHYRAAAEYLLAIPPSCGRQRLACLWPVLIGLETLKLLAANGAWLHPARPSKVTRGYVYRSLTISLPAVGSDTLVRAWIDRLVQACEENCAPKTPPPAPPLNGGGENGTRH